MRLFRGFSLIETVVAIFLISVILLLFQALVRSSVLVRTSKDQGVALAAVRNELETLRANGYAALPASGSFSDSLMSALPPAATATLTVSAANAQTKQVSASVVWREPGAAASSTVSLTTLITENGGLP